MGRLRRQVVSTTDGDPTSPTPSGGRPARTTLRSTATLPPTLPPTGPPMAPSIPGATAPFAAPVLGTPPGPYGYHVARRSTSGGLGGTIQGFMWAMAVLGVITAIAAVASIGSFSTYWDTSPGSRAERLALDDWTAVEDTFIAFGAFLFLAGIVVVILLMIWMNSAHKTTQQFWSGPRSWSSGWTVGGWFIPLANLIIPKLVLTEIEKLALAPRTAGAVGADWRSRRSSAIGWLWWIGLIVGLIVNNVGTSLGNSVDSSAGEIRTSYALSAGGCTLIAVSSVFGALYVRRIGRRVTANGVLTQP